jgi:CRISPR-associated protein Cas1
MSCKSVYVSHPGARVHRLDGKIAVSIDKAVVDRWAPEELERVLIFGNAQVTTQVIALLLRNRVSVSFFSSSGGLRGQLVSPESGNIFLRLAQHARFGDGTFRLGVARALVRVKLRDARSLVRRFARNHPEAADAMETAADAISRALLRADEVEALDALRGVEGAAAAAYFKAFAAMIRPPFEFERRSQHPAHNPVNALLNLGYTLLANEVASCLESAGFDPRIGYYHGIRYSRSSLALDLVETHRVAVIDRLTLSILNRRMFGVEDFEERGELGVRMTRSALRRYLALYEDALGEVVPRMESPRARIRAQVSELRQWVMAGEVNVGEGARLAVGGL